MPTYQYRCQSCRDEFEVRQSFTDDALTTCPDEACGGPVSKVFSGVGISFKGDGFYKNDHGSTSKSRRPESNGTSSGSGDSSSDSGSKGPVTKDAASKGSGSTDGASKGSGTSGGSGSNGSASGSGSGDSSSSSTSSTAGAPA